MGHPFADAFLGWLLSGRGGEAEFRQDRLVREAVEGDAEGGATPGAQRRLEFDECAVDRAGERPEDPVDALQGELALFIGKAAAGDLLGENDGWRRLALDARRKELFGDHLCAGPGESADEAGESTFGDTAF